MTRLSSVTTTKTTRRCSNQISCLPRVCVTKLTWRSRPSSEYKYTDINQQRSDPLPGDDPTTTEQSRAEQSSDHTSLTRPWQTSTVSKTIHCIPTILLYRSTDPLRCQLPLVIGAVYRPLVRAVYRPLSWRRIPWRQLRPTSQCERMYADGVDGMCLCFDRRARSCSSVGLSD